MAVTRAANVIRVAADNDTVSGPLKICGIKYKAGTSSSAQMKVTDTSGMILWEATGDSDLYDDVYLNIDGITLFFDIAGGAIVYLYVE
jgi:hypothetical protein